jgi:hypothetical protein
MDDYTKFHYAGTFPPTGLKAIRRLQHKVLAHNAVETVEKDGVFSAIHDEARENDSARDPIEEADPYLQTR